MEINVIYFILVYERYVNVREKFVMVNRNVVIWFYRKEKRNKDGSGGEGRRYFLSYVVKYYREDIFICIYVLKFYIKILRRCEVKYRM